MKKTWVIALLTLVLGISIGFVWGRLTARTARVTRIGTAADTGENGPASIIESGRLSERAAELLEDPDAVETLREMASQAFDWGASPNRVVRGIIDQMGDAELVALVSSLTDFTGDELRDGRDMRAFVERLATVAMDGTLTDPAPLAPDVRTVEFAAEVDGDNAPVAVSNRFVGDDPRIFAVFESDNLSSDQVFAKWTRVADGEVMLFGRYSINPRDAYSYVWLGRPGGGWEPGEYRVDFYNADTAMEMIASGRHVISN